MRVLPHAFPLVLCLFFQPAPVGAKAVLAVFLINPRKAVPDQQLVQALAVHIDQGNGSAVAVNGLGHHLYGPAPDQTVRQGLGLVTIGLLSFRRVDAVQPDLFAFAVAQDGDGVAVGNARDLARPGKGRRRKGEQQQGKQNADPAG